MHSVSELQCINGSLTSPVMTEVEWRKSGTWTSKHHSQLSSVPTSLQSALSSDWRCNSTL